jgi:hypothetical protein
MSTESLPAGVRTVVTTAPTQVRILQTLQLPALHANLHECGFHAREVQLLPAQTGLLLLNEVGAGGVGVGRGTRPGEPLDQGSPKALSVAGTSVSLHGRAAVKALLGARQNHLR